MEVCRLDGTPLVMTFEMPGAEWHCLACGGWFGLFAERTIEPTAEQVRLGDVLAGMFRSGERGPVAIPSPPAAIPPSIDHIKCDGCGADSGRTHAQGKPGAWYQRGTGADVQIACSRPCIDTIAERTGSTRVVLPW